MSTLPSRLKKYLPWLLLALLPTTTLASNIRLAVAANFRPTMLAIVKEYNKTQSVKISVSSASTGVLYAQISQGAPFDVFFSADAKTPELLSKTYQNDNQDMPNSATDHYQPFSYALGLLAFWCGNTAPENIEQLKNWQGSYALANPKLAPYGAAATEVIKKLAWRGNTEIQANNVAQVAQFVSTENVSCGFVPKSLLPQGTPSKQIFMIDQELHQAIVQKALVLPNAFSSAKKAKQISHFIDFIRNEGQALIVKAGYGLYQVK